MDNDDKINQAPAIISQFLSDNLAEIAINKATSYDLDKEFALTKKNNTAKIPLILLAVILLTVGVAYLLTGEIKDSSREVSIAIQSIDDLNLRNILDVVEKTKEDHAQAVRKFEEISANKRNDLAVAESTYNQSVSSINAMQGKKAKKAAQLRKAEQDYEAEKQRIDALYAESLAEAQAEVSMQESNLTAFDSQRIKEAEEQQEIINNQKRLFDLEKRTLTKEYETRIAELEKFIEDQRVSYEKTNANNIRTVQRSYQERLDAVDPVFKDKKADAMAAAAADIAATKYVPFSNVPRNIPAYSPIKVSDYEILASQYEQICYLLGKIESVPFENDLLSYISSLERLTRQAGATAETSLGQTTATIRSQNSTIVTQERILDDRSAFIAQLLKAANPLALEGCYLQLDAVMKQKNIAAIVLDASNADRILLRVNAEAKVQDGITGYVFRNETQHIDNITFIQEEGTFYARWAAPVPEAAADPAASTEGTESPVEPQPISVPSAPFKAMDVIFLSKS